MDKLRILGRLFLLFILLGDGLPLQAAERLALVIGNGAYEHTLALDNPPNDAHDIATLLRQQNFTVLERQNLPRRDFEDALADFGRQAEQADLALVFYAGHGIQVDGRNYLLPVDAQLKDKRDLRRLIPVDDVLSEAAQAQQVGVVILDACRDNPLAQQLTRSLGPQRSAGINRGLARNSDTPQNLLVAYATAADATAADGEGRNSPYTTALKQHLNEPGVDLRLLFGKVRDTVMAATHNQQRPYTYGSLGGRPILLTPPRNPGTLWVDSQPSEAMIYVDGGRLGIAPQRLDNLPPGQVTVEAKLEGYRDYREKIWIKSGKRSDLRIKLHIEADQPSATMSIPSVARHGRTFRDDFSGNLSAWKRMGDWTTRAGRLYVDYDVRCGGKTCDQADLILDDVHQPQGDYAASVDFIRTVNAQHPDLYVAGASFILWRDRNAKLAIEIGGAGWKYWGGRQSEISVTIQRWAGSWQLVMQQSFPYTWDPDQWHTARIEKQGDRYSLFVDDQFLTDYRDTFLNGTGQIGLHAYGTKRLDNFVLTETIHGKYSSAQPPWCRWAKKASERTVCASVELGLLDNELNQVFAAARQGMSRETRELLESQEDVWRRQRDACGTNKSCLSEKYIERIDELRQIHQGIAIDRQ